VSEVLGPNSETVAVEADCPQPVNDPSYGVIPGEVVRRLGADGCLHPKGLNYLKFKLSTTGIPAAKCEAEGITAWTKANRVSVPGELNYPEWKTLARLFPLTFAEKPPPEEYSLDDFEIAVEEGVANQTRRKLLEQYEAEFAERVKELSEQTITVPRRELFTDKCEAWKDWMDRHPTN
jgi:hypothetical protein